MHPLCSATARRALRSVPSAFPSAIGVFAPVVSRPVWQPVQGLLTGAVLAPGPRTVPAMRRRRGRRAAPDCQTYHRVLQRAVWSPRTASRRLLRRLVAGCLPRRVRVGGLDDPIERRRGAQSQAHGISRDPVRSSHPHCVNVRGLRGLAGLVRAPLAWADRVWARPLLPVLGPSERFEAQRGRRQQPWTARAGQRMRLVVRWWPGRASVWVADSRVAGLELRNQGTTLPRGRVLTRRRLAAALDDPPPPRAPGTPGRPRLTGKRRPTLEAVWTAERTPGSTGIVAQWDGAGPREVATAPDPAGWSPTGTPPVALRWGLLRAPRAHGTPPAWLAPALEHTPEQRLPWCVRRWPLEGTFEEARAPLGMATQRPGHERAMARTTPALLRRSSLITRTPPRLIAPGATCGRSTAW